MKPWPPDAVAIIVGRVDDPFRQHIPGSVRVPCWHCGHPCMISKATLDASEQYVNSCLLCANCAYGYYQESGQKIVPLPKTAAQKAEEQSRSCDQNQN